VLLNKRVQKSGKDIGSTLGSIMGTVLGCTARLVISCSDMLSITFVAWALSSIVIGYPSWSQVDVRETIVAVLYIALRLLGYLIQNRLIK